MAQHTNPVGLAPLDDQESGPNCGVTAIAILTGESFGKVYHLMGLTKRKNWKGSTYKEDRDRAIILLGYKAYTVRFEKHEAPSLAIFAKHIAKPGQAYLVLTYGHAQVVKDGYVQDQRNLILISRFYGRNKRVIEYSILTKDETFASRPSMLDQFI